MKIKMVDFRRFFFFGLRSLVIQKTFQTKTATSVVARLGGGSGGAGGGRGCTQFVHGRSRMTRGPRIPAMGRDGARRVFTNQAVTACAKSEAP